MRFNMGLIGTEHSALFAPEIVKISEFEVVYILGSTNINQSAPSLVKMYLTIRFRMCLIMDLI